MDKKSIAYSKSFFATHGKLTNIHGVNKCLAWIEEKIESEGISHEVGKKIYKFVDRMDNTFKFVKSLPIGPERKLLAQLTRDHFYAEAFMYNEIFGVKSRLENFTNVCYKYSLHDDD